MIDLLIPLRNRRIEIKIWLTQVYLKEYRWVKFPEAREKYNLTLKDFEEVYHEWYLVHVRVRHCCVGI